MYSTQISMLQVVPNFIQLYTRNMLHAYVFKVHSTVEHVLIYTRCKFEIKVSSSRWFSKY